MEPANIRFGGGATETVLHPLVAVWMLIAVVLILTLPRNKVIVPFLLAFFTTPLGQVVVLGGLHFPVLRILILTGLARLAIRKGAEARFAGGFNALDTVVVLWTVSALVIVCLRWMELPAFVKFVGDFLDSLGGYLVARFLIPDREALRRTLAVLASICVILGLCMINEHFTHINVFGLLGGASVATEVRNGHVRAASLMGSIQSGAFAGPLIPVFVWLWTERKSRVAACAGLAGPRPW